MSITDELRDYARGCDRIEAMKNEYGFSTVGMSLNTIADRIDEEHEREVQQAHADGLNEQMDFHDNFVPSHYSLLPVDADGKVIHIGDKVTCDFGHGETITVLGFGVPNGCIVDADKGVFAFKDGEYCWFSESFLRHVEHPTIEDMLRKFAHDWCSSATGTGSMTKAELDVAQANVIIEYGEKLREMLKDE